MWHLNLTAERGELEKRMWFAKNSRRSDSRAREKKKNEVYNLTRSPLTAALYYLNAWNRLARINQSCSFKSPNNRRDKTNIQAKDGRAACIAAGQA